MPIFAGLIYQLVKMKTLLDAVRYRNEPLFCFGLVCFCTVLLCVLLIRFTHVQITGVNAWYKPLKFSLSIGLFAWTMAWYVYYLDAPKAIGLFNWVA